MANGDITQTQKREKRGELNYQHNLKEKDNSSLLFKPTRTTNKILVGHVPLATPNTHPQRQQGGTSPRTARTTQDGRVLSRELLDNGQGKYDFDHETDDGSGSDMSISEEGSTETATNASPKGCQGHPKDLLLPPIIHATGKIATGATTPALRKQNKLQRNETLLTQPVNTQWVRHRGETMLENDHWYRCQKTSEAREMAPQGLALKHEAAHILEDW
jgi:hypothetical protein